MKTKITKTMAVSLFLLLSAWCVNGQTFTWDKSELTTAWANTGGATVVKASAGVTLEQRGTTGSATSYIGVDNSNPTLALNLTSDAVTITSASENITSIKITYSSNGSTSTTNPYVGYNASPTAMGEAFATVSGCEMLSGVYGNVGVEQTYTPPAGTKFVILVRGGVCGTVTSPSVTCRIYRIEVFTTPNSPTITAFNASGVEATINQTNKTITAELPYGTNLTAITPTVTLGGTATIYSPTGAQNFSTGTVTYTATNSGDGSSTSYAATLTASTIASNDATLSDLKVDGATVTGFAPATLTYDVALPYAYSGIPVVSATINNAAAKTVIAQPTAVPSSATVTVTAQDNSTTKVYAVNFTRTPASTACDLTSFSIGNKEGVITDQNILVKMELATDVTNLTPVVAISNLATYTPLGARNFSSPVDYVVTAQDGVTQKTYTVTVQLVDMKFSGPYPYETIFPTGYLIPDWMSSPTLGGISFSDPYGSGTTGSDKILWYDNPAETTAATSSVMRISTAATIDFNVSKCDTITAKLSSTGTRTYQLFVNGILKTSSPSTAKNTIATLTYDVNLNEPTKISINTLETTGGATLGYLKIGGAFGVGLAQTQLPGIMFDGKTIHNNKHLNLQVFDATGRMILSSNQNILMNTSPEGTYLVKSSAGILKIVLQK